MDSLSPAADKADLIFPAVFFQRHNILIYRCSADKILICQILNGTSAAAPAQIKKHQQHTLFTAQPVCIKISYIQIGRFSYPLLIRRFHTGNLIVDPDTFSSKLFLQMFIQNLNVIPHRPKMDGEKLRYFGHIHMAVI